jgi:FdrA protein
VLTEALMQRAGEVKNEVLRGVYRDSVELMQITERLKATPGVIDAAVVMGTDLNKKLLREAGLLTPDGERAGPNDLVIAVRALEETSRFIGLAKEMLEGLSLQRAGRYKSIEDALASNPDIRLAVISVPGRHVEGLARKLIERNVNLFIFSDHVPLEVEIELKRMALERGLLVMGPDAGTSIVEGVGLGFANRVRRGQIGLVGSTGSGLQEVTTVLDGMGLGVSNAIGVGGRDLKDQVGGMMTVQALRMLQNDPETEVIAVISKSPGPSAVSKLAEFVRKEIRKPVVFCLLGLESRNLGGVKNVPTLTSLAIELARAVDESVAQRQLDRIHDFIDSVKGRVSGGDGFVRALYCGGTLATETIELLCGAGLKVRSNVEHKCAELLHASEAAGHSVIDYGAEEFTEGRPHPIIDPSLRNGRASEELRRPEVKSVIIDVVAGTGAPADLIERTVKALDIDGTHAEKLVVRYVGTPSDPQSSDLPKLEKTGAIIAPTNAIAAITAVYMLTGQEGLVHELLRKFVIGQGR